MDLANGTTVQEFILLGFEIGQQKRFLLLAIFAVLYILTLVENITIIMLVHVDAHLACLPMYILLSNFSWLEMCYVSTTVPRMLFDLAFPHGIISFHECFLQFYIFFSLGDTECFFLSAMALDRYLAICHPLRYPQMMSKDSCYALVATCWTFGFLWHIVPVILISKLSFCGPNIIDHFVCDPGPVLSLACSPRKNILVIYQFSMDAMVILGNLLFVVLSYGAVIFTLMKSSSQGSRMKAFSTISFHLIVVTLFYGTVAGMYVAPSGKSHSHVSKLVTLFYTAITPFLNPLIYCLRNDQVREALGRLKRRKMTEGGNLGKGRSILYVLTLAENILIITLVVLDTHLSQLPMYILLSNFSWLEVCYVSATVPRMLFDLASPHGGIIPFHACLVQVYFFFSLGSTECFFLSVMALDRYLAICHPLRYPQIMSPESCYVLVATCWVLGFLWNIAPVTLISTLSFCGPNIIDNLLCDPGLILSLASPPLGNVPFICQISMTSGVLVNIFFVVLSYGTVILTLVKTSSQGSHKKAFSTISFHLIVVTLFYGSVAAANLIPRGESQSDINAAVTLFYTAVTPFLNPLIYCLRNDQVKEALGRLLTRMEK
ncbi:olfactory receptor 2M2-like [Rhineura floridana]|uniref:olfactory receptor 2M2-like n=1 Tax=Rhineura floridana TaxID=261503 RepID=UPI002AC8574B|nr:olfactory receptor 2M2-like [Rhineura floridana]